MVEGTDRAVDQRLMGLYAACRAGLAELQEVQARAVSARDDPAALKQLGEAVRVIAVKLEWVAREAQRIRAEAQSGPGAAQTPR